MPRVINLKIIKRKEDQLILRLLYPEKIDWRPATRGDCSQVMRPCPYVACRYHLYLDTSTKSGNIRLNYNNERAIPTEVWDLEHSCSLDIADEGHHSLGEVAEIIQLTRERVRQIIDTAIDKVREDAELRTFSDHAPPVVPGQPEVPEDVERDLPEVPGPWRWTRK